MCSHNGKPISSIPHNLAPFTLLYPLLTLSNSAKNRIFKNPLHSVAIPDIIWYHTRVINTKYDIKKGILMKKFSKKQISEVIANKRKQKGMTQAMLSEVTGINRSMIGRIENEEYLPRLDQLEVLADVLNFELEELFETETPVNTKLTAMIHEIERGERKITPDNLEEFRGMLF